MYSHTFENGKTVKLSWSEIEIWQMQESQDLKSTKCENRIREFNHKALTPYEKIQFGRCLDKIINILEYGAIN